MKTPASLALLLAMPIGGIFIPVAEGIVRRHDVSDSEYLTLAEDFPSVGKISNNSSIRGSGVLVHERWALTAAHLSGTPNEFTIGGMTFTIEEFVRHPDWDGDPNNGDDIALARFGTAVSGIAPSDWFTGTDQTGVVGTSVGFGRTGTGLTGEQSGSSGDKRASESTIERIGSTSPITPPSSVFEYDFLNPEEDPDVLDLEGMAVLYDSGGPVFIDVDGNQEVAGIHSYAIDNDGEGRGTYGDTVGSTRVSQYDEWITATIPEPSTWSVFIGANVLLLACARLRFRNKRARRDAGTV